MPLSLVVGILLVINGTPMSFDGKQTITTLEGQEQVISQGPTAAIVPIKQLGTNGGGYFGTNSAHPLENPNAFTNILECWRWPSRSASIRAAVGSPHGFSP